MEEKHEVWIDVLDINVNVCSNTRASSIFNVNLVSCNIAGNQVNIERSWQSNNLGEELIPISQVPTACRALDRTHSASFRTRRASATGPTTPNRRSHFFYRVRDQPQSRYRVRKHACEDVGDESGVIGLRGFVLARHSRSKRGIIPTFSSRHPRIEEGIRVAMGTALLSCVSWLLAPVSPCLLSPVSCLLSHPLSCC